MPKFICSRYPFPKIRNSVVLKIYDSVKNTLTAEKRIKEHNEALKKSAAAAKKLIDDGKHHLLGKADGMVTRDMITKAQADIHDDSEFISERDVFDSLVQSTKNIKTNTYGAVDKSSNDKINLLKFSAFLSTTTLSLFNDPLSKHTINSIFFSLERYRESGIPFTVFRTWILTSRSLGTSDYLDKKNLFGYLLRVRASIFFPLYI